MSWTSIISHVFIAADTMVYKLGHGLTALLRSTHRVEHHWILRRGAPDPKFSVSAGSGSIMDPKMLDTAIFGTRLDSETLDPTRLLTYSGINKLKWTCEHFSWCVSYTAHWLTIIKLWVCVVRLYFTFISVAKCRKPRILSCSISLMKTFQYKTCIWPRSRLQPDPVGTDQAGFGADPQNPPHIRPDTDTDPVHP